MTRTIRKLMVSTILGGAAFTPLMLSQSANAQEARPAANEVPEAKKKTTKELHQLLLNSSGWVIWQPTETTTTSGTGWIVDKERKLMITNDHVVEGTDTLQVIFPIRKDGKLVREEGEYSIKKSVKGTVIDRDPVRDLALVQLESLPETSTALKMAAVEPEEGDIVRTIGGQTNGSDGFVWGNVSGEVRTVGVNGGLTRLGKVRSVMTTAPINGGNSGGPLINEAGELVAVNSYYKPAGESGRAVNGVVSGHVSVEEVRKYLKEIETFIEPKTVLNWTTRGERKLNAGRVDAAAKDFAKAIETDEKNAYAYYLRGRTFIEKNDARTALEDLNEAIKLDGNKYDYRVYRGVAYRALGKIDEAMSDFSAAIRQDPSKGAGYNQRGVTYFNAKKFDEASEDFTRAIEKDDKNPLYFANRAEVANELKKYDAAAKDFAVAAKLAPWKPEYIIATGNMLILAGKTGEAAEVFNEGANRTGNPIFLAKVGDALRMGKDFKQAVKFYTDALKGLGDKSKVSAVLSAYVGRGRCFLELKQFKDAVDDFTKVVDLTDGKNGDAFALRAAAHKGNGAANLAADDFAAAKKLGWKADKDDQIAKADKEGKNKDDADADKPSMVGTWKMSVMVQGVKISHRITFNEDGTFQASGTVSSEFGTEKSSDTGTWKISGTKLTIRGKEYGTVIRKFEMSGDDECEIVMEELDRTVTFSRVK